MNVYQKEGYIDVRPQARQKKTDIYKKNKKMIKKEVDIRQTEMSPGIQASEEGTDDEEWERASAGVSGSWE